MTFSPIINDAIVEGKTGEIDEPQFVQFSALKVSSVNEEQPEKTELPIELTPSGITTDINEEQP